MYVLVVTTRTEISTKINKHWQNNMRTNKSNDITQSDSYTNLFLFTHMSLKSRHMVVIY